MVTQLSCSRRRFLAATALALTASRFSSARANQGEPVIDIHQHTLYGGRSESQLVKHQRAMGVTKTILLPAGRVFGLDAGCGGNESVLNIARKFPNEYAFFANEVADLPEARSEIEKYLKLGAVGIGEQKFKVDCDSIHMERIAEIAREYDVPVLLHFEHNAYNMGFERFHRILEKFPTVNFIGHAQTWWANLDKNHTDQRMLYPRTKVTPGGMTDRYLSDYPNIYGDFSGRSGLGALIRDEEHARGFLERHQEKLLYGSDCNDAFGRGPICGGAQTLDAIRRLAGSKFIERKILSENARRLFKFS
jgi:predicted TIM-barrel fold metal-dependent hydrolase